MGRFGIGWGKWIVLLFALLLVAFQAMAGRAETEGSVTECARIDDDGERLRCYDALAGRKTIEAAAAVAPPAHAEESPGSDSYLAKQWELDERRPRGRYAIVVHRDNYLLPVSYNTASNREPTWEVSPSGESQKTEVKFQISLKTKLWQDILGHKIDLWFGYTQRSFWQFYNFEDSAPFRETNYEPEMLLNFRTDFNLLGMRARFFNVGFNHQSNGRSEPLSRSWNRIVGNLGFENKNLVILLKTWYRVPESEEEDDNPDMDDYLGYGEVWGYYFLGDHRKHRMGVMFRNNLQSSENRGALQLEYSYRMFEKIGFQIQYFNGYGESLVDYNRSVNRIGIGFILTDWADPI